MLKHVRVYLFKILVVSLQQVPWLWYQYNVSPGLKHCQVLKEKKKKVEDIMLDEYIRSIAVVSAGGVRDFLEHSSEFV
jgi:hypothetical protein